MTGRRRRLWTWLTAPTPGMLRRQQKLAELEGELAQQRAERQAVRDPQAYLAQAATLPPEQDTQDDEQTAPPIYRGEVVTEGRRSYVLRPGKKRRRLMTPTIVGVILGAVIPPLGLYWLYVYARGYWALLSITDPEDLRRYGNIGIS